MYAYIPLALGHEFMIVPFLMKVVMDSARFRIVPLTHSSKTGWPAQLGRHLDTVQTQSPSITLCRNNIIDKNVWRELPNHQFFGWIFHDRHV
jgi:hypothetical protein